MRTKISKTFTTCAAGVTMLLALLGGEAHAQQANAAANAARVVAAARAAAAQASLGRLSIVNQGATKFRYARDGVVFDLVDRHGRWTQEEAIAVRDALDRLPMVYLRKARGSGAATFFRDAASPTPPLSALFDATNKSAIAVPMWPFHYVAFGDRTFRDDGSHVYHVVTHELGHCVQWELTSRSPSKSLEFSSFSWLQAVSLVGDNGMKSWNGFVSNYARTNFLEDFAEAASWYWHSNDELLKANPGKYRYMRDVVYEGVVPPAAAKDPRYKAVDRVRPAITRLSSDKGVQLAVRDVYGTYFMAPGDGGWNKVRFSQVNALQVPVSRTHMYATVPASCNPSKNWLVTVETQDGKSDGVKFEVEGAWWRFW